jgi:hypothetical protein
MHFAQFAIRWVYREKVFVPKIVGVRKSMLHFEKFLIVCHGRFFEAGFEIDSVTAMSEMERLGPQKLDDFSVLTTHSFRMAGKPDHRGNS